MPQVPVSKSSRRNPHGHATIHRNADDIAIQQLPLPMTAVDDLGEHEGGDRGPKP